MSEEEKARSLAVTRLRADETSSLLALYASLQEIDTAKENMEKRLRTIPGGWRDISLVRTVLSKLIDRLLGTVPIEKLQSISRNMRCMTYRIHFVRPVTLPPDEAIVNGDDLETLIRCAHNFYCVACDKDCNKCNLGKALDHTMIQCRKHNESWSWIDCETDYDDEDVIHFD